MSEPRPLAEILGQEWVGGATLTGDLARGTEIADLDLEECRLEAGVLERSTWRRCRLTDCTLTGLNLSMSTFVDVRFADCTLLESKAQAVNWTGLTTSSLAQQTLGFERCRLDYGSFMGIDGRGMRFTGCSLVDADFGEADLREVEFVDCDLSGARFAGADLRGALLVEVRGLALDVREARTDGLRVDMMAAGDVVTALGLEVVDGDGRS